MLFVLFIYYMSIYICGKCQHVLLAASVSKWGHQFILASFIWRIVPCDHLRFDVVCVCAKFIKHLLTTSVLLSTSWYCCFPFSFNKTFAFYQFHRRAKCLKFSQQVSLKTLAFPFYWRWFRGKYIFLYTVAIAIAIAFATSVCMPLSVVFQVVCLFVCVIDGFHMWAILLINL